MSNPCNYYDYTGNKAWPSYDDFMKFILNNVDNNVNYSKINPNQRYIDIHYNYNKRLSFSGYIIEQDKGNAAKVVMGTAVFGSNACGWVAVYNVCIALGDYVHPADIVKYFESHGSLLYDGAFGVNPIAFGGFFSSIGRSSWVTFTYSNALDYYVRNAKVAILCYWWGQGAHYITLIYDPSHNRFIVYNEPKMKNIPSINDFIDSKGYQFISLTIIN